MFGCQDLEDIFHTEETFDIRLGDLLAGLTWREELDGEVLQGQTRVEFVVLCWLVLEGTCDCQANILGNSARRIAMLFGYLTLSNHNASD